MAYLGYVTHTFHKQLKVPEVDMVIFSGDMSNPRDLIQSEKECRDFIEWMGSLPIKHKLATAGNHDLAIERRRVTPSDFHSVGITYLENDYTEIEGFRIFGTPITPSFGEGWAFNKNRAKMNEIWEMVEPTTDILISHGPPLGILDLTQNRNNDFEQCGDRSLLKHCMNSTHKLVCFGHIHRFKDCINQGTMTLSGLDTIFSNGSLVEDGRFDKGVINNGNIINL
ncbi:MAG: metallophosphoesterase [Alphaproteobacteria bacterium]